ncbi:hypothetical protein E3P81_03291 [Wallemia ichthyophaga]|nr:hypothetical protein E3P97_03328 [Wallemia ichthyophaga]TIB28602.1 hypothetical protein E3P85_03599 [Wallemia ichthyophaga]TIB44860.1 hypothetical protein E3P82_03296 [Wallemia ichthyophaga]TIB47388.1 hypothetical protein E3P81_03291 [Wallemia ichthyophaga]TIB50472.1 hypothetical protein E3P80_03300 [Wallemia ichthyophaga]
MGGDSTTHELLSGLSSASAGALTEVTIKLIIVPLGTANALYHSLHSHSHLNRHTVAYRLLALHAHVQNSENYRQLRISEVVVDQQTSRLAHVVVSTAVHAALLHRSEELRSADTSVERFKTAFMDVRTRWTEGTVHFERASRYQNGSFTPQMHPFSLEGPFTYLLATHIDRLEDGFVVAPKRNHFAADNDILRVVVVRPARDSRVRDLLDNREHDKARQIASHVLTDVMYAAYDNGRHVDMHYDNDEHVVEYFAVQGMVSFEGRNQRNQPKHVCVDGGLLEMNEGFTISRSSLSSSVSNSQEMDNRFIAFPVPQDNNSRRLSDVESNRQPPSYEEAVDHRAEIGDTNGATSTAGTAGTARTRRLMRPAKSFRHSASHPPPPVPTRPHQYHSISHINQYGSSSSDSASTSTNDRYTDSILQRNVQPLRINKRESFRPQPPTPLSPAISDNQSLHPVQQPHTHSRTSSVFSTESRVEPFYSRQTDDELDAMHNKLTLDEQEDQDLAQAIEISKTEVSQPFAFASDDVDHDSTAESSSSAYTPSAGPSNWSFVNPSEITPITPATPATSVSSIPQNESTFVKKERMRQHVENHNLKKWQTEMEDVTSEWHNLVNQETLHAFDKAEIARQSVLFEFMRTEKMYYNDLHFLEDVFVPPIRDTNMIPQQRRQQFLRDAVFNLSNLVANHKRGLMRIFDRQNEEHPLIESVADLILRACIIWQDDYEAYIKHWPIQEATLKSEMQSNKAFAAHCEACSRHPKAQRQNIIALLQRPVFRLPRYPLLLNRMLDYTPEDHSDRENLPIAARAISDIAKSTQPGIEQSNNKVKFWEMASALDFKLGELHDIDLLNDLRTLLYEGLLFKRERAATDLHGWRAKKVFILDNYILITEPGQKKKTDPIRYSLTSRPIPLEVCHIDNENPSPTHRTNCLLADERRSDGSRILFTHTEPEREVHGFILKNIGNGKEYKLYASTPEERQTWKSRISEAIVIRRAFVETNKLLVSHTLTDNIFQQSVLANTDKYNKASPHRINSASIFQWGARKYVTLATPEGVYMGFEDDKDSYRKVIGLNGVEGVTVLSQYSLLILHVDGQLYGYDLEEICPTSSHGPRRKFGRIRLCSSSERVTYYRVGSSVGKKVLITYVSNKTLHKSTVQFYEPLPINTRTQAYQDRNRVKKPKREVWIRETMPSIGLQTTGTARVLFPFPSSKHVAVVDEGSLRVLDPTDSRRILVLPRLYGSNSNIFRDRQQAKQYQSNLANITEMSHRGKLKPIELFTTKSGEYVLVFDSMGLYVNEKGVPLKNANVLRWNGTVNSAAVDGEYLILFCERFIEVRQKRSGKLLQIINLTKDVRLVSQNSLSDEEMVAVERHTIPHLRSHGLFDHAFKLTCTS